MNETLSICRPAFAFDLSVQEIEPSFPRPKRSPSLAWTRHLACDCEALAWLALVITLTGCSYEPNEQEGQPEPKLASYHVSVTPGDIKIAPNPATPTVTVPLTVSVSCEGENLPPDCGQHVPNWTVRKPATIPFVTVAVADPTKPATEAVLTFDTAGYLAQFQGDASSLGDHWFTLSILPGSIPPNLKLGGNPHILVTVVGAASDPPPRQEQPPEKPRLGVSPNNLFFLIQGLTAKSTTQKPLIIYSGPPTVISAIELTGPGADKFAVLGPALPFAIKGGESIHLELQFAVAQEDLDRYQALVSVKTANLDRPTPVLLIGQRQNY